jgi:surface carbohydrate biosynthesis protein
MNVYIKIEIKERELLSRMLVGSYLALKGHDIFLGEDDLFNYLEKKILNPGVILEKSISNVRHRINQLNFYKKNNFKLTTLDEEGGLNTSDFTDFAKRRFSKKTLNNSDLVFCWGKYDYTKITNIYNKFKNKFIISGNPRFDFNKVLNKKKNFKKKIIIIPSFFTLTRKNRIVDNLIIRRNLYKNKIKEQDWFNYVSTKSKETFNLLDLIYNIKKRFKKLNLEIWVHPKEDINLWKKIIPEHKYLKYCTEKNFNNTSENHSLFLFTGSTLGLDVIINKRHLIYYNSTNNHQKNVPIKFAKEIKDSKKVLNYIENFFKEKNKKKINKNIENYVHNAKKDIYASKIISDKINQLQSKEISKKNTFLNNNLNHLYFKNFLRLIRQKLKYEIYNNKFAPFTASEIQKTKKILVNFDKKFKNISIQLIGPKLIRIRKL